MTKLDKVLCLFALLTLALRAQAVTYYVDFDTGNDTYMGTSTTAAWKTLAKVNTKTFLPGDKILFKAGCLWTGTTQLHPLGSGTSAAPIIIDMYGTGSKPAINATTATGNGAVYLNNQSYWEINNLEVMSSATADGDRRGIYLSATNFGVVNHLYVKNCYVHDVRGSRSTDNGDLAAKRTGGIVVETVSDTSTPTRFNDVIIESCEIANVARHAIVAAANKSDQSLDPTGTTWDNKKVTNMAIRNNVIHDIAVNAMIIRLADSSVVVEHNVIYNTSIYSTGNTIFTAACNGTIFQYNEGYNNLTPDFDGSLYDSDMRSQNIIFQYSYSHDNNHGLFWTYPTSGAGNPGIIVRYNISRNDKGIIFAFSGGGGSATSNIYNNTIYLPNTGTSQLIFDYRAATHTIYAYNNIFYLLNSGISYDFGGMSKTFDYNTFYGVHPTSEPADAHKSTANPMLVDAGTGGIGFATLDGYKLQAGSPSIDAGRSVTGSGGLDFWGNAVPYNRATDRGANEYTPATDTTPPAPSPMSFATAPYGASSTSVAMVAATASDSSGVEYLFTCLSGGGHSSAWQDSTGYTDTGLEPSTMYTYTVVARDKSAAQNQTLASASASAYTQADTTPPTPSPMSFDVLPYASGMTSISMVATTASDIAGVEYMFTCTMGGGHSSAWQDSTEYVDSGLTPGTTYGYTVKARDKSVNQTETLPSDVAAAATVSDTVPPLPNPMTWAIEPNASGSDVINMTASTATDISGVEYLFVNITDPNHSSAWQSSPAYVDTGLANNTTYVYAVAARDLSAAANQTGWSVEASATTLRYVCQNSIAADMNRDCQTDFADFALFAGDWSSGLPGADLTGDTLLNWQDVAAFAEDWLLCDRSPSAECWR